MNTLRKLTALFLIIPLGLLAVHLLQPATSGDEYNGLELLTLVIGFPILLSWYLAWFAPGILSELFGIKMEPRIVNAEKELSMDKRPKLESTVSGGASTIILGGILLSGVLAGAIMAGFSPVRPPARLAAPAQRNNNRTSQVVAQTDAGSRAAVPDKTPFNSGKIIFRSQQTTSTPTPGPTPTITQVPVDCIQASPGQVATLDVGVKIADENNSVKTAWFVKSSIADGTWFGAAKLYDAGGQLLANEPAVWAVIGSLDNPEKIISVNDFALQYSGWVNGADNDPPFIMGTDNAQAAYDCALKSN